VIAARKRGAKACSCIVLDRRRSRRLDLEAVHVEAALIDSGPNDGMRLNPCEVLNFSYGGMCLSTERPVEDGDEFRILIHLGRPFSDFVLTKARVVWSDAGDASALRFGVRFLESSTGWLGPEDCTIQ
jgi:hypothetical protein